MALVPRHSFHHRLLVGLLLLSLGLAGACAVILFSVFEENEREEAQAWMQATIVQVADRLGSDAELTGDRRTLRVQLIRARQALIRELDGALGQPVAENTVVNMAVMVPSDDKNAALVVAAIDEAEIGQTHDMTLSPARRDGWTQLSVENRPDAAELLRAYVPIRSPAGQVAEVLRIDLSGDYFDSLVVEAVLGALLVFAIGAGLSWFVSRRFSRAMAQPVEALAGGMNAVARGDLKTLKSPETRDEFDGLTSQFNQMVGDLKDRERLKKDMTAAAAVQQHLLPKTQPSLPGYDVFGAVRYCDETGGDYFDFLPLPNDQLGIVVADVSGHGLKSALLMTAMRAVLHSTFAARDGDLVAAVQAVNDQLLRDTQTGAFVSAFAAVLDGAAGRLDWLSAGHDPAVVFQPSRHAVTQLPATGIPLGILDQAVQPGPAFMLASGDVIAIGTDGVSQCRDSDGEFFGLDRLASLLAAHHTATAREIWEQMMADVQRFQPAESADDDMTLVIIRRE